MSRENRPHTTAQANGLTIEHQEIAKREVLLVTLWLQGLNSGAFAGVHGTSLESIISGDTIPGTTSQISGDPKLPEKGDLYFVAIGDKFDFSKVNDLPEKHVTDFMAYTEDLAVYDAMGYAKMVGQRHRFLSLLEKPLTFYNAAADAMTINYGLVDDKDADIRHAYPIFRPLTNSDQELLKIVQEARKRKGIVIGIKPEAFDLFRVAVGDGQGWAKDLRIKLGDRGFPLSLLSGLQVQKNSEEEKYFQQLYIKHKRYFDQMQVEN